VIRGPQDFPEIRQLLELADQALRCRSLTALERKALRRERARVAELLQRTEIEAALSLAVARGEALERAL
jgi:hypothetical protein